MMKSQTTPPPRSWPSRLLVIVTKLGLWFIAISLLLVLIFRFLPVPITATMLFDDNGATRDWESLCNISPNMARAVIGAEDCKFCTHNGFDTEAIEKAIERNTQAAGCAGLHD